MTTYAGFDQKRMDFSLGAAKLAEQLIYPRLGLKVKERPTGDKEWLDMHYGVDALAETEGGRQFSVAERFRSEEFAKYEDITIRLESQFNKGRKLEFKKSIANFMIYAYVKDNAEGFVDWLCVDLPLLLRWLESGLIKPEEQRNRDYSSKFLSVSFKDLHIHGVVVDRFRKQPLTLGDALQQNQIPRFIHPISKYLLSERDSYLCAYHAFYNASNPTDNLVIKAVEEQLTVAQRAA